VVRRFSDFWSERIHDLTILLSSLFGNRCVSYGVLPHDEAERLHKKVTDRKRQMRLGGGSAATSPARKTSVKAKKRVIKEERFEPDLQVSGGDGIGTAVL
jgi:hypothetical protein